MNVRVECSMFKFDNVICFENMKKKKKEIIVEMNVTKKNHSENSFCRLDG